MDTRHPPVGDAHGPRFHRTFSVRLPSHRPRGVGVGSPRRDIWQPSVVGVGAAADSTPARENGGRRINPSRRCGTEAPEAFLLPRAFLLQLERFCFQPPEVTLCPVVRRRGAMVHRLDSRNFQKLQMLAGSFTGDSVVLRIKHENEVSETFYLGTALS